MIKPENELHKDIINRITERFNAVVMTKNIFIPMDFTFFTLRDLLIDAISLELADLDRHLDERCDELEKQIKELKKLVNEK